MLPEIILLFLIGFCLGAILFSLLLFIILSGRQQAAQEALHSNFEHERNALKQGRDRAITILEQRSGALRVLAREHDLLRESFTEISASLTTAVITLQSAYKIYQQLQEKNIQLRDELLAQNINVQDNTAMISQLQNCHNELLEAQASEENLREDLLVATNRLQEVLQENQAKQAQVPQHSAINGKVLGLGLSQLDEIEPVNVIRLYEHNIQSMDDLARQEPEIVAAYVDVPVAQAAGWITQSQIFLKQN